MEKTKKCPTCGQEIESENKEEGKKENFKEVKEKAIKMMLKKK